MNRFGTSASRGNSSFARSLIGLATIAVLAVLIVYPLILTLQSSPPTVTVESSDIILDTQTPESLKPGSIIGDEVSNPVADFIPLLQNAGPEPILKQRDVDSEAAKNSSATSWNTELYYVSTLPRVQNCVYFFEMFDFAYPGCEQIVANWEVFVSAHWNELDKEYQLRILEMPEDAIKGIARRGASPSVEDAGLQASTLDNGVSSWRGEIYDIESYDEVKDCVDFYRIFLFWYNGCERAVYLREAFITQHWRQIKPAYRTHFWDMVHDDEDDDDNEYIDFDSLDESRRSNSSKKPLPRPANAPIARHLITSGGFTGNHGPVAVIDLSTIILDDRSQKTTISSLKPSTDVPVQKQGSPSGWECPASRPNGAFCIDYIKFSADLLWCENGVAHMATCTTMTRHLEPAYSSLGRCWEPSPTSGDAKCVKNCVVYSNNGNGLAPAFNLPGCTPLSYIAVSKEKTHDPDLESIGVIDKRETAKEPTNMHPDGSPSPHVPLSVKPRPRPTPHLKSPPTQPLTIVDKRKPGEFDSEMVPGVYNIPYLEPKPKKPKPARNGTLEDPTSPKPHDERKTSSGSTLSLPLSNVVSFIRSFPMILRLRASRALQETRPSKNGDRLLTTESWTLSFLESQKGNGHVLHPPSSPSKLFLRAQRLVRSSSFPFPGPTLQVQNVAKDCRGKTGSSLDQCRKQVQTKNSRVRLFAIILGVLGFLFVCLVILDKVRRARSRKASVPVLSKGKSPTSTMSERATTKYVPATMDGTTDGWTHWLMGKQETQRQLSPSPRVNAPRIPSLTLPKPSLATVRKVSGLGPDLENMTEPYKGRWKSDSKLKWSTTL